MNDFSFMKKMSEEDAYLFKKCIRKMILYRQNPISMM